MSPTTLSSARNAAGANNSPAVGVPLMPWRWDGDFLVPLRPKMAEQCMTINQVYPMVEHQHRSDKTHNHEFAWLAEAWKTLPENLADEYPTPEHLRKRALIQSGYYTETVIDVGSAAAALRVAVYARSEDQFAYVIVRGTYVVVRKAKSQSRRAMDRAEFQASKSAVLETVAAMIGVEPAELMGQTESA